MAIPLKVKWIDQRDAPNVYQRISHIGGSEGKFQWKHTDTQAIVFIEDDQFDYYVEKDDRAVKLEVGRTADGHKFLKTEADTDEPRHLLNLPGFPVPAQPQSSVNGI